ncbi:MAG: long-chain fatty acid--CoA ligase [Gemmatimonadales bacterium]
MRGLMMDYQLTLPSLLDRARMLHRREIVSRTPAGMHRYTYREYVDRVDRLRTALARLGVGKGDRVGTFAWNSYRHFETYFAAPCMGAVIHTLNIRLHHDQVAYIANHAEDKVICVDATLLPAFNKVRSQLKSLEHVIVYPDDGAPVDPAVGLDYEQLLAEATPAEGYPDIDENDAMGMCYTSGTTGNPKGVVYSHRAVVLHTLMQVASDLLGMSAEDSTLAIVPLFHANAWGFPYAGVMTGSKMVWPGPFMQPKDIAELIDGEGVTFVGGVPTIIGGLYQYLRDHKEEHDVSSLRSIAVGGAACPQSLMEGFRKDFGVWITHAWGMTELAPIGTICKLKPHQEDLPYGEQLAYRLKQGVPVPLVEVRIVDEQGKPLPHDGKAFGELQVRGPWISSSYYNDDRSPASFQDGWFRTGDVANIDPEGFVQLVDRTKDVVKSGGEWISSVELENAIMLNPKVAEAAVIGVSHPKWTERPLACVVPKPGMELTPGEVIATIKDRFATWWLPNDVVFIEAVPKTSVGKFDKKVLRERFKDHQWSE